MSKAAEPPPGTPGMSTLKAAPLKPSRIRRIPGDALEIPQGSPYPALYRLERQDLIAAE